MVSTPPLSQLRTPVFLLRKAQPSVISKECDSPKPFLNRRVGVDPALSVGVFKTRVSAVYRIAYLLESADAIEGKELFRPWLVGSLVRFRCPREGNKSEIKIVFRGNREGVGIGHSCRIGKRIARVVAI